MIGYIYKTTNLKNGKIYIGQHLAEQFEPDKYIGSGHLLKPAIKYYGKKNFKCELLATCDTIEELHRLEKEYIKKYNSQDRSIGYNITDGGDDPWNHNKKMLKQYCIKNLKAQRNIAPNVYCYSLDTGKLIKIFDSTMSAAESLQQKTTNRIKTIASRICSVCLLGKGHAYGYIWRYERDKNIITAEELELEHTQPRAKKVAQYDKENNLIKIWESAAAYSKTITDEYKKQRHIAKTINEVCCGKFKSYKGYIWKYV